MAVGPQSLQFAGALGGLLGALPPRELFDAANKFLLRQHSDESFATAVHVVIDLEDGRYTITSAGHPPALRWDAEPGEWVIDNARGMALGIMPDPELHHSAGVLPPGGALLFYTDGVVESRTLDLDVGIAWLQRTARDAVRAGSRALPGGSSRQVAARRRRPRGAHPEPRRRAARRGAGRRGRRHPPRGVSQGVVRSSSAHASTNSSSSRAASPSSRACR